MNEDYNLQKDFKTPEEAKAALDFSRSLVVEQRHRALKDFVLSALAQIELVPIDRLHSELHRMEENYIDDALRTVSDHDHAYTAKLKRLTDSLLKPS